jgi:hypothetical protein
MSIQFPAVQDTIVAILVVVAIAAALSVAFGVAASFFQRSKAQQAGRPGATTTAAEALIAHPTQTDDPIRTPASADRTRELVLR